MSVNLLESKIIKLTKISRDDYALLCRENPEHYKKTELLEGVIVDKMTKSNLHDYYSQIFFDEIQKVLPKGYILRTEKGINFNDSELEPDISIVKGKLQDYKNNKPSTATLIIEISVSSLMSEIVFNDVVIYLGNTYACNFEHTATDQNLPGDNGSGFFYWDLL